MRTRFSVSRCCCDATPGPCDDLRASLQLPPWANFADPSTFNRIPNVSGDHAIDFTDGGYYPRPGCTPGAYHSGDSQWPMYRFIADRFPFLLETTGGYGYTCPADDCFDADYSHHITSSDVLTRASRNIQGQCLARMDGSVGSYSYFWNPLLENTAQFGFRFSGSLFPITVNTAPSFSSQVMECMTTPMLGGFGFIRVLTEVIRNNNIDTQFVQLTGPSGLIRQEIGLSDAVDFSVVVTVDTTTIPTLGHAVADHLRVTAFGQVIYDNSLNHLTPGNRVVHLCLFRLDFSHTVGLYASDEPYAEAKIGPVTVLG